MEFHHELIGIFVLVIADHVAPKDNRKVYYVDQQCPTEQAANNRLAAVVKQGKVAWIQYCYDKITEPLLPTDRYVQVKRPNPYRIPVTK